MGRRESGLGVFDYTSKSQGPSIGDGRRGFGQSVTMGGVSVGAVGEERERGGMPCGEERERGGGILFG